MHQLAPGIYSRHTKEELQVFFKELDLVIVDLDECIFPGITKVALYKNICLLLIRRRQLKNCVLLSRLLAGAVIIIFIKFIQRLCLGITNRHLMICFAKVVKPVPISYLQEAAKLIPGKSYVGARETLEILSKGAQVGIISQGLDMVLDEYVRQFNNEGKSIIDFWDGNILSDMVNNRKGWKTNDIFIFDRYSKEAPAKKRIAQFGSKRIMVIGHNAGDLGMIKAAREHKGIIVGFNPTTEVRKLCDIIVLGKNWVRLRQVVQEIRGTTVGS